MTLTISKIFMFVVAQEGNGGSFSLGVVFSYLIPLGLLALLLYALVRNKGKFKEQFQYAKKNAIFIIACIILLLGIVMFTNNHLFSDFIYKLPKQETLAVDGAWHVMDGDYLEKTDQWYADGQPKLLQAGWGNDYSGEKATAAKMKTTRNATANIKGTSKNTPFTT